MKTYFIPIALLGCVMCPLPNSFGQSTGGISDIPSDSSVSITPNRVNKLPPSEGAVEDEVREVRGGATNSESDLAGTVQSATNSDPTQLLSVGWPHFEMRFATFSCVAMVVSLVIALLAWKNIATKVLDSSAEDSRGFADKSSSSISRPLGRLFICAFLVVLGMWASSVLAIISIARNAEHAANIVDATGLANTVFSGLAFAGLLVTVILQSVELRHQRHELRSSRLEQRKNAKMSGYHGLWGHYSSIRAAGKTSIVGTAVAEGWEKWSTRQIHELIELEDELHSEWRRERFTEAKYELFGSRFVQNPATLRVLFENEEDDAVIMSDDSIYEFVEFCMAVAEHGNPEEIEAMGESRGGDAELGFLQLHDSLWELDSLIQRYRRSSFRGQPKENWTPIEDFGIQLNKTDALTWVSTSFEPARISAIRQIKKGRKNEAS